MPRKYLLSEPRAGAVLCSFNEAGADAPEIPRQWEVVARDAGLASMRPGRMPRKYPDSDPTRHAAQHASMRPGRMPRKYPEQRGGTCDGVKASMRPGRMPRKYHDDPALLPGQEPRFNEAGADAPEIPPGHHRQHGPGLAGFNEAGADAPEIPHRGRGRANQVPRASMRPGRMPRKYRWR